MHASAIKHAHAKRARGMPGARFPHKRKHGHAEAVAAGSPYRYPLWLARALNSAIYDVKWDYESDRAIARIADFYIRIAVFIINLCCCAPFCKYT